MSYLFYNLLVWAWVIAVSVFSLPYLYFSRARLISTGGQQVDHLLRSGRQPFTPWCDKSFAMIAQSDSNFASTVDIRYMRVFYIFI